MINTATLVHGSRTAPTLHAGQCWTDDTDSATTYAGPGGWLTYVEIDLAGLVVREVPGYDRTADVAPGDDGDAHGADVLVYEDEDQHGRQHRTWRLMTPAAVGRVASVRAVSPLGLALRAARGYAVM